MIFDTRQWLALAIVREIANLVEPDTGQDERAISTFSFDLTLLQAQCLNDPLKDAGLTEVFVDDEGNHYGKELGDTLKKASSRLNEKGKKRNKLHALAKKHDRQGKQEKARNIRRRNLGHKKSQELKRRAKITITNQINRAINELIKRREPKVIVTEKLDIRGKAPSKEISRRVSYWRRSTLKDRFEFKASAARLPSRAGQSGIHLANLS